MIDYKFIGWCKEGNSDKVWGVIQLDGDRWGGSYVSFWGRRGRTLQTKLHDHESTWDIEKLIASKERKGYNNVDERKLNDVYPEFQDDLERTAMWSALRV